MTQTGSPVVAIIPLVIGIFMIAAVWRVFSKAGKPGWAAIVPIYNAIVMLQVAGKPGWWFILLLIPVVNLVISIIACIGIAKNFGKGGGFAAGLILLPIVFYPILGFGGAQYMATAEAAE
jgi:hypothetical protein